MCNESQNRKLIWKFKIENILRSNVEVWNFWQMRQDSSTMSSFSGWIDLSCNLKRRFQNLCVQLFSKKCVCFKTLLWFFKIIISNHVETKISPKIAHPEEGEQIQKKQMLCLSHPRIFLSILLPFHPCHVQMFSKPQYNFKFHVFKKSN